jgi:hypothetical protein
MSPICPDEKTANYAIAKFVALGVLPENYERILTFNRLRALRFDFLVKRRLAKDDLLRRQLLEAADLCGQLLAHRQGDDGVAADVLQPARRPAAGKPES